MVYKPTNTDWWFGTMVFVGDISIVYSIHGVYKPTFTSLGGKKPV